MADETASMVQHLLRDGRIVALYLLCLDDKTNDLGLVGESALRESPASEGVVGHVAASLLTLYLQLIESKGRNMFLQLYTNVTLTSSVCLFTVKTLTYYSYSLAGFIHCIN